MHILQHMSVKWSLPHVCTSNLLFYVVFLSHAVFDLKLRNSDVTKTSTPQKISDQLFHNKLQSAPYRSRYVPKIWCACDVPLLANYGSAKKGGAERPPLQLAGLRYARHLIRYTNF